MKNNKDLMEIISSLSDLYKYFWDRGEKAKAKEIHKIIQDLISRI